MPLFRREVGLPFGTHQFGGDIRVLRGYAHKRHHYQLLANLLRRGNVFGQKLGGVVVDILDHGRYLWRDDLNRIARSHRPCVLNHEPSLTPYI